MAGATATHILHADRNGVGEIVFMSLLIAIAALRWRDRLRFRPAATPSTAT
jgi:hypothetical protein